MVLRRNVLAQRCTVLSVLIWGKCCWGVRLAVASELGMGSGVHVRHLWRVLYLVVKGCRMCGWMMRVMVIFFSSCCISCFCSLLLSDGFSLRGGGGGHSKASQVNQFRQIQTQLCWEHAWFYQH